MHAQLVIPQPGKGNRKTGDIPTAYVARESCPLGCPLLGQGCYAETGNIGLHWRQMRGVPWATFCQTVAEKLGPRQLWRYAVAGDLPGFSGLIDRAALQLLTAANGRRLVIAYSHKPVLDGEYPAAAYNRHFIAEAIAGGFLVNLSANDPRHADALVNLGLAPVVTILPHAYARRRRSLGRGKREWSETIGEYRDRIAALPTHTPAGRRIAVCPATYTRTSCEMCRACAKPREAVIGFPAHGGWRVVEQAIAARDVPAANDGASPITGRWQRSSLAKTQPDASNPSDLRIGGVAAPEGRALNMEPDFRMMVLRGFPHGVGFVLALLLTPLFLGHPWIAVIIVLGIVAVWRGC